MMKTYPVKFVCYLSNKKSQKSVKLWSINTYTDTPNILTYTYTLFLN